MEGLSLSVLAPRSSTPPVASENTFAAPNVSAKRSQSTTFVRSNEDSFCANAHSVGQQFPPTTSGVRALTVTMNYSENQQGKNQCRIEPLRSHLVFCLVFVNQQVKEGEWI
jgi:hypothetical protein